MPCSFIASARGTEVIVRYTQPKGSRMTQIGIAPADAKFLDTIVYPEREEMIAEILEFNAGHLTDGVLANYGVAGLKWIYRCRVLRWRVGQVKVQA